MKLRWLELADHQLAQIVDYIAADNPDAANRFELRILKAVEHLPSFPDAGRVGRVKGTRELIIGDHPYIVVYRSIPGYIEVLSVLHASRQWPTI